MTSTATDISGVVTPARHRIARIERKTAETSVLVELDLDGTGKAEISTGVGFFDHMLGQIAKHGADRPDACRPSVTSTSTRTTRSKTRRSRLGTAFADALGDKVGIRRYGNALIPLDEVLVQAAVDLSGRPVRRA